ncbi:hypothetical protein [Erwinia tasmaniensis]|uniref:hypothetical protein n=1 Tax=Erwinia tasmaniensis TaxID=338565 RepID=UPI000673FD45|nr:hypothetical protein [Erwinia tasmaniensis]
MKELQDLLEPLADLLNQSGLKSKQAAFNRHYNDLVKAKEIASWESISNYLNELTGDHLTAKSINTLFHRAKAKVKKQLGQSRTVVTEPIALSRSGSNVESHLGTEVEEPKASNELLNQYLKVCFNNERIALRAIEGGVSIDTIGTWKSPNPVRLGNTLTNYISKK